MAGAEPIRGSPHDLKYSLATAARKLGLLSVILDNTTDGKVIFPYDEVRVNFTLKAA
ncbi:MAG TPA: hypothetical protein VGO22_05865 [Pseudorhizobium sp.]|nr:hypothetical protein [Pseudorhizobium sp.]